MKLVPDTSITKTFSVGNGYFVDIVSNLELVNGEKEYEVWVYHEQSGIKELAFGILEESVEDLPPEERMAEVIRIVEEDIEEYIEEYL